MSDCVAIVSGGMDSVTLLHTLVKVNGRRPAVISFVYGPTIEQVRGDSQPITYVSNRNMIFLALAAAKARSRQAPHQTGARPLVM